MRRRRAAFDLVGDAAQITHAAVELSIAVFQRGKALLEQLDAKALLFDPWIVCFSLIVGGAARTDLIAPEMTEQLTRAQFRTLQNAFTALPDETL